MCVGTAYWATFLGPVWQRKSVLRLRCVTPADLWRPTFMQKVPFRMAAPRFSQNTFFVVAATVLRFTTCLKIRHIVQFALHVKNGYYNTFVYATHEWRPRTQCLRTQQISLRTRMKVDFLECTLPTRIRYQSGNLFCSQLCRFWVFVQNIGVHLV